VAAVCALALALGGVGLNDEGYAPAGGDMARYLMNGVFVRDLLADRPFAGWSQLVEYAHLYYARYPALSLGHHPVLLPLLEAPLFGIFGISVSVGRLVPLASLLLAAGFLHAIVSRLYGPLAALLAGVLFVTSPMVTLSARWVMAEITSIAFLLACAYFLQRFFDTERRSHLAASTLAAILCIYAKPNAVLLAPAIALGALAAVPLRRLLARDVLVALITAALLASPALIVPLTLSSSNALGVMSAVQLQSDSTFLSMLADALQAQLAWVVLAAAAAALVRAALARDARAVVFAAWIACVAPALFFFGGSQEEGPRYTLYWVPALCVLAASLAAGWRHRFAKIAIPVVLLIGAVMQVRTTQPIAERMTQAGGYEEAAQFVVGANPGPTVLFSGDVDTGYFPFFVRKHDPERRLIVLRSDKLFTTSLMARPSVEERIASPAEIYPTLRRFGTRFVVLEDRPSRSRVLEWLREELKSPRFIERRRIPIRSTDFRLVGTTLAIYEILDPSPPVRDAVLSMRLPIIGRSLTVRLQDLLDRRLLR
jgi:hypothetical protein